MYSWRVSSDVKTGLAREARRREISISAALDLAAREWLHKSGHGKRQLRLPLVTSEAVLAELFRLVGDSRREIETAWKFLRSGAIRLAAIDDPELSKIQA